MIKSSGMALHSENIYASQVALLYERQSVLGIAINLLLAAVLVIAYWGLVPESWLLGWLGGMVLLMSVRLWLTWHYRQDRHSDRDWGRLYSVLVVLTGLLWGGLAVMLIPSQTPEQRALFLLILAGLIIAALPMLAVIKSVVLGYSLAVQLPIIGLFAFSSDSQGLLLSTAVLIFLLGTTGMALYLHQIIFDWLRLRQENQVLLEESRSSRRDLLTGLPNRVYLQDKLEQAIARAKQNNKITK
ncbi:MAG: GGDEF domain-containing protein [Gammaproteobacteria bacterium]